MQSRFSRLMLSAAVAAALLPAAPARLALAQTQLSPQLSSTPRPRVILADRIVAVVNDEVITRRELDERVSVVTKDFNRNNRPLPPTDVLDSQVLERLIIDRAQLQFAKETQIRVDDAALDRTIARIAEQNQKSPSEFRDVLEKQGVPFAKFRDDIRNEIIISRVRDAAVEKSVNCTDGEIEQFMADNGAQQQAQTEVNLGHILVVVPENASPEQIEQRKKRAEEALAQLKAGTDFAKVSVSFSEAPEALKGGELGMRTEDRLPQLFVDAEAKLQPGEISGVLRSSNGFHILKLLDRKRGGDQKIAVEQIHARHILIKTNELVSQDQAKRRLEDLRERLINKAADFAELARLYSNDGSRDKGGDLGWIYPGDTVPEFEKAMSELKVGEISQPVQSQFGWHLIQVLERRNADMSPERVRAAACQTIRERKSDEAYQEWMRQLRDRTYVELRLEDR
ncbi:MAG TPA: peptidylprolyl isomerase [Burkholderiales bacterium]|jgi:peptidyl-prolyl cis-trans isomerase SurA|nr:peptidylprolyl isomerase [Burkholderiales bacterium]